MRKIIFSISTLAILMTSCFNNDDDSSISQGITGSSILGGTDSVYSFCVGDEEQELDIVIVEEGTGENSSFIIRNGDGEIADLPSTIDDFPSFTNEEVATYSITHINYQDGLEGLEIGSEVSDITNGVFVLSNAITVNVEDCREIAAAILAREDEEGEEIEEGYVFCVDGLEDRATDIVFSFDGIGETGQIVVTDEAGWILGLPGAFEGPDFDEAGVGVCYIRHIVYNGDIEGLTGPDEDGMPTANVDDLVGVYELSDFITVTREDCSPTVVVATLEAGASAPDGEYTFSVGDGTINNITDLVTNVGSGENAGFVITDDTGVILGLPGTDIGVVDFDLQGTGVCYIRYINYDGDIEGLATEDADGVTSNVNDLVGEFKLSNFIVVNRIEAE